MATFDGGDEWADLAIRANRKVVGQGDSALGDFWFGGNARGEFDDAAYCLVALWESELLVCTK